MIEKRQLTDTNGSIRNRAFKLLDKNHELTPSQLCQLLLLDPKGHGATLRQYKMQWKREYKNGLSLKCLKFHNVFGWVYALKLISREKAVGLGDVTGGKWRLSSARNRMLVWKNLYGRLEWFETGRIKIWVRKPANWGKVKQLLACAFFSTGLIADIQVFDLWANSARLKGEHMTQDLGERLPYSRNEFLKDSLGVIVKTGDISHPTCVEIEFVYPDWAERNERMLDQNKRALENFSDFLKDLSQPKSIDKKMDRSMVI